MIGPMKGILGFCLAVVFGFAFAAGPAGATTLSGATDASLQEGNLAMALDGEGIELLAEAEMADLRGGFGGMSFSLFFSGVVDNLGTSIGSFAVNSGGVSPVPTTNLNDLVGDAAGGQVFFENLAGSFSNFSGAAQVMNVIGNNIVAQQNMLLQINMINVTDPSRLRVDSLSTLLGM